MKTRTLKKALSLFLAVLMIALALPLTMLPAAAEETTETTPASIKHVKLFAKYGDAWDVHAQYGDVSKITDGDPAPGYIDEDGKGDEDRTEYTYYQSDDLYDSITYYYLDSKGRLTLATADSDAKTYMGYAVFELNGVSALDDVTIWLAGDEADHWANPAKLWTINDAYDILVSDDGESWELLQEFAGMCGDNTNAGAGWTEQDGLGNIASITDANGYDKLGHQINLDGVETKYFAIGVKKGMNSTNSTGARNAIVFGEVTVNGTVVTPDAVEKTPAERYAEADDGDFLYRVNFHDTTWNDDYRNSDNWNSYVKVSEDGRTAEHLLHGSKTFGTNNKRAHWGGIAEEERFSLDNGETYTLYFDAQFKSTAYQKYCFGIMVDGNAALAIDGHSGSYMYAWNTKKVGYSGESADKWNYHTNKDKTDTQQFAIEVDSANETLTLYVADEDGSYNKVREMTYSGADISGTLSCQIFISAYSNSVTVESTYGAEISDLRIYKGLVADDGVDRAAEYDAAKDGDLLDTVNFNSYNWYDELYDKNNCGAEVEVSKDGTTSRLTLLEGVSYNRAIYGGFTDAYKYPLREVVEVIEPEEGSGEEPTYVYGNEHYKYTLIFDLEFGNTAYNKYGLGVMVDGDHSIVIDGFGCNRWWQWNTERVGKSDAGEDKWNYSTDVEKSEKHTFAVEVDPENNSMTLYVADANGAFNAVRTMSYDGDEFDKTLNPRIYTRKLDSKSTSDENSWTEISDLRIYKGLMAGEIQNQTGASVRLTDDSTSGIRFKGEFRKYTLDSLKATYGEENVELGMIITPTDYLTATGADFTMEALDACTEISGVKYVDVKATAIHVDEDDLFYYVNCALVNIKEGNYAREFSARAYIKVNGEVYKYADYDAEYLSRSIAEVARKAYGDTETEMGGDYVNAITIAGVTVYSPYDADEMKTLMSFFNQPDGEGTNKNSTISVLTYNLEYKRDDVWEGRNPANAVQIILDVNPDVVGLQEDTEDWNDYLAVLENNGYANLAGNRKYNKWTNNFGNGWAFNDIYYKKDKFELVKSGWDSFKNLADDYTIEGYEGTDMSIDSQGDAEGWFSTGDDIGRTFSYAVLKDNKTGEVILFVNTHLHYGDGTSSSDPDCANDHVLREYQSRLLGAWMADMADEYPTQILTGDMNAHLNSKNGNAVLNGYSDRGLSFAREEACITGDTEGTLAKSSTYLAREEYVFDHILFRNTEALTYTVVNVMNDPGTVTEIDEETGEEVTKDVMRYPSDHIPVYATFAY